MSNGATVDGLMTQYLIAGKFFQHNGDSQIDVLVCGEQYFPSLETELQIILQEAKNDASQQGAGDFVYICAWGLDDKLVLDTNQSSDTYFTQLAKLAQLGVDVRVLAWSLCELNLYKVPYADLGAVGVMIRWLEGDPPSNLTEAPPLYNIGAVEELRALTPSVGGVMGFMGPPPLAGRVLLDYSGKRAAHQKAVIVQSQQNGMVAFLGGMDLMSTRQSDPTQPTWHDVALRLTGGGAYDVYTNFTQRWAECVALKPTHYINAGIGGLFEAPGAITGAVQSLVSPKLRNDPAVITKAAMAKPITPVINPTGASLNAGLQILRSFPDVQQISISGNTDWVGALQGGLLEIQKCLVAALTNAKQFVYVEDQVFSAFFGTATSSSWWGWGTSILFPALINCISKNNAKLIILGPGDTPNALSTVPAQAIGDGGNYGLSWLNPVLISPLQASKVNAQVSFNALKGAFVHAKVVIVDDTFALVGSANFADCSLTGLDIEMSAGIVSPTSAADVAADAAGNLTTGSIVQDLRIKLWAYHFGFDVTSNVDWTNLRDTSQSFGLWDSTWTKTPLATPQGTLVTNILNTFKAGA